MGFIKPVGRPIPTEVFNYDQTVILSFVSQFRLPGSCFAGRSVDLVSFPRCVDLYRESLLSALGALEHTLPFPVQSLFTVEGGRPTKE